MALRWCRFASRVAVAYLPERSAAVDELAFADSIALRLPHNVRSEGQQIVAYWAARRKTTS